MAGAVIFDVDGVIFDSERVHVDAWEQVFPPRGIRLWEKDYLAGVGVCDRIFLENLRAAGTIPPGEDLEAILEAKIAALIERLDRPVRVFPGARETIEALAERLPLCAASNSDRRFVEKMLAGGGLLGRFSYVLARNDVARPKPEPDIYLMGAERLGVAPADCLVIEDSPVGIEAARRAGMRCVAVAHTVPAEKLLAADTVLPCIAPEGVLAALEG